MDLIYFEAIDGILGMEEDIQFPPIYFKEGGTNGEL